MAKRTKAANDTTGNAGYEPQHWQEIRAFEKRRCCVVTQRLEMLKPCRDRRLNSIPWRPARVNFVSPPFNRSDLGVECLRNDRRWQYHTPNAATRFVLANGSIACNLSGKNDVGKRLIETKMKIDATSSVTTENYS